MNIPDIVEFTRQRLGFDPNPLQESVLRGGAARHRELHAAVGQIHGGGSEGGASRVLPAGQPDPGAVSERAPERRVRAQGGRFCEPARDQSPGRGSNEISIAFPNRSRIVGLPHNVATLRAGIFQSERDLWLMSTPNGKRGFFYAE